MIKVHKDCVNDLQIYIGQLIRYFKNGYLSQTYVYIYSYNGNV